MMCNLRTLLSKLGFSGWRASHRYMGALGMAAAAIGVWRNWRKVVQKKCGSKRFTPSVLHPVNPSRTEEDLAAIAAGTVRSNEDETLERDHAEISNIRRLPTVMSVGSQGGCSPTRTGSGMH